jgi:hypothetical protein
VDNKTYKVVVVERAGGFSGEGLLQFSTRLASAACEGVEHQLSKKARVLEPPAAVVEEARSRARSLCGLDD